MCFCDSLLVTKSLKRQFNSCIYLSVHLCIYSLKSCLLFVDNTWVHLLREVPYLCWNYSLKLWKISGKPGELFRRTIKHYKKVWLQSERKCEEMCVGLRLFIKRSQTNTLVGRLMTHGKKIEKLYLFQHECKRYRKQLKKTQTCDFSFFKALIMLQNNRNVCTDTFSVCWSSVSCSP